MIISLSWSYHYHDHIIIILMAKGQLFTVHRNCNRPNYGAVGTLTEQGMGRMGIPKRLGLEGVALQDSTGSFPFVQRNSTDSTYSTYSTSVCFLIWRLDGSTFPISIKVSFNQQRCTFGAGRWNWPMRYNTLSMQPKWAKMRLRGNFHLHK